MAASTTLTNLAGEKANNPQAGSHGGPQKRKAADSTSYYGKDKHTRHRFLIEKRCRCDRHDIQELTLEIPSPERPLHDSRAMDCASKCLHSQQRALIVHHNSVSYPGVSERLANIVRELATIIR